MRLEKREKIGVRETFVFLIYVCVCVCVCGYAGAVVNLRIAVIKSPARARISARDLVNCATELNRYDSWLGNNSLVFFFFYSRHYEGLWIFDDFSSIT